MEKRTIHRGISKASFKDQKEYSYSEARELLGECKRSTIPYIEQEQCLSGEWHDIPEPKIIEKNDFWINKRGDLLLATPLPENTLNIFNMDLKNPYLYFQD